MMWIMPTHHTHSVIIAFDDRLFLAPKNKNKTDLISFRYENLSILTEPNAVFEHRCVLTQSLSFLEIYPLHRTVIGDDLMCWERFFSFNPNEPTTADRLGLKGQDDLDFQFRWLICCTCKIFT